MVHFLPCGYNREPPRGSGQLERTETSPSVTGVFMRDGPQRRRHFSKLTCKLVGKRAMHLTVAKLFRKKKS